MERDTAESDIGTGDAFGVCPQTVVMTFADDPGPVQTDRKAVRSVSAGRSNYSFMGGQPWIDCRIT